MFDGFGLDYLEQSDMPALRRWQRHGLYQQVTGVMPSVTNANNASICCGVFPRQHGITGNSYLDLSTGHEEYMEAANLLLAPTLFEHAARQGVSSALLSSKKKTISLLSRGAAIAVTPEEPSADWVDLLGPAPSIYSREINYWLVRAAIYILRHRPEIGCLYVHTTDYPMHTWAPDAPESKEHLKTIDALLGEACEAAPDAAFLLTADHGMNHKDRCYDLDQTLANLGLPIRISISAERDKYVLHHRGLGGTAWIYLNRPEDRKKVFEALRKLVGVESVLTREEEWSWACGPPKEMKNAFCPATALYGSAALPFVIPSAPRISYYAAPEMATCAAFVEESRMKFADHTKLDRKSGEVEGSAVPRTFLGNVFRLEAKSVD
jgi:phosphonoacetate hydrolase